MKTIPEGIRDKEEIYRKIMDKIAFKMRVAMPGIVQAFDSATQTATVKVSVTERIIIDGRESIEELPLLILVPILLPRAGGYVLALPVNAGDECLVVFGDCDYSAWWQSGSVSNQIDRRRHDLSDGFAILGCWSQPRVLPNYPTDAAQLRKDNGTAYIELKDTAINLVGTTINLTAAVSISLNTPILTSDGIAGGADMAATLNVGSFALNSTGVVGINATGGTTIDTKAFLPHTHTDPQGGQTGGVT